MCIRDRSHGVRYWYAFDVVDASGPGSKTRASDFPPTTREARSDTGTFELPPPKGVAYPRDHGPLRAAVFSCANWAWGHFHAYDAAARGWGGADEPNAIVHADDEPRIHVWFHLGDYYYEYGRTQYPNEDEAVPDRWRSLDPPAETVTLDEYRRGTGCTGATRVYGNYTRQRPSSPCGTTTRSRITRG